MNNRIGGFFDSFLEQNNTTEAPTPPQASNLGQGGSFVPFVTHGFKKLLCR